MHGLRGVTMSRIAAEAGIGRATLYKYFPDVQSILTAWHQEQVSRHLAVLQSTKSGRGTAHQRLRKVLETFAFMTRHAAEQSGVTDLVLASLHSPDELSEPEAQLRELLKELIDEGVVEGDLRDDVPSDELALYCLNVAVSARHASSQAAVDRLITVTMAGLTSPGRSG